MTRDVSTTTLYSTVALVAFSPAILAHQGARFVVARFETVVEQIAKGRASPFHNHLPNARQQFVAQVVHLNLVVMPFVAANPSR